MNTIILLFLYYICASTEYKSISDLQCKIVFSNEMFLKLQHSHCLAIQQMDAYGNIKMLAIVMSKSVDLLDFSGFV